MDEFKFVMKCFLFACAVLALTQLKTNGLTIESRIQSTLISSPVANFINQAAEGGVKLFEKASETTKNTVNGWLSSHGGNSSEPQMQVIRYPAAKKTVDNSDLRLKNEVSSEADFDHSELE
ncbi:MAG: hypothetical protein H7328_09445 [Bdellovibrio sp.]|nr:hypothetical protein [Bdellovibrio sp.]